MLIAQSHSDDSHVNATAPCMSGCPARVNMHFAQARPSMSCIPQVLYACIYMYVTSSLVLGDGDGVVRVVVVPRNLWKTQARTVHGTCSSSNRWYPSCHSGTS